MIKLNESSNEHDTTNIAEQSTSVSSTWTERSAQSFS